MARAHAILFGALLGSVGCGGEAMTADGFEIEEAATEELGTLEQALGGNWRPFTQTPNQSGGFTGDPAVCNAFANQGGWAAIGRSASSNKLRWSIQQSALPATAWANLGDRVFNSSPACAALDEFYQAPANQWSYQKAILGRDSSNNRYYIRVMKIPPGVPDENNIPLPTVPTTVLDWTSISNSAYVSGPGAAVVGGALVVCGMRTVSSSTRVWCKYNTLSTSPSTPFDNSNWTPGAEAPALPVGWTAQGDPAVVNSSHVFPFAAIIAVRATRSNPSQTAIYASAWDGSSYTSWGAYSTSGVAVGDGKPALESSRSNGVTVVFRGTDNKIYEGTGLAPSFSAINAAAGSNTGWGGAPAAVGGLDGWEGGHVVLARKSGQFHFTSPCPIQGQC